MKSSLVWPSPLRGMNINTGNISTNGFFSLSVDAADRVDYLERMAKHHNCNIVRLSALEMDETAKWNSSTLSVIEKPATISEAYADTIAKIEELLPVLESLKIWSVIDIRKPVGYNAVTLLRDSDGQMNTSNGWVTGDRLHDVITDGAVDMCEYAATNWGTQYDYVLGYDILNEPRFQWNAVSADWTINVLQKAMRDKIREIDPYSFIVFQLRDMPEPGQSNSGFPVAQMGTGNMIKDWDRWVADYSTESITTDFGDTVYFGTHGDPWVLDEDRIVYSPHYYHPRELTFLGISGDYPFDRNDPPAELPYPSMLESADHYADYRDTLSKSRREDWNIERHKVWLQTARNFQLFSNKPMFVGEFASGLNGGSKPQSNWHSDVIQVFEEYSWDWTCWGGYGDMTFNCTDPGFDIRGTEGSVYIDFSRGDAPYWDGYSKKLLVLRSYWSRNLTEYVKPENRTILDE